MSNVSCEIIQDLLPLYCDGVCSEESSKMILAHIQTCDKCKEELRVMDIPIDIQGKNEELEAAEAASKVWKKNMRKAFRMGIILAAVLASVAVLLFLGSHYIQTSNTNDMDGLAQQLKTMCKIDNINIAKVAQKGDYLAISGCDDADFWYMGIYNRDDIFSDRWQICGSLQKVKSGNLVNWNYETPEGDTILVCYGAELSDDICGYTFTNSGITYTCPVGDNTVLNFFFIPDVYDRSTHLEPIYQP